MGNESPQVLEEFKQLCVDTHVECTFKSLPNPGSPFRSFRMLEFRSFTQDVIKITQQNKNSTVHLIPAMGSVQMILQSDESLPNIQKAE